MTLTPEQIESFNDYQICGMFHPFTCPVSHDNGSRDLVATETTLKCPTCDYTQDWAHGYMLDGSWRIYLSTSPMHKALLDARKENGHL